VPFSEYEEVFQSISPAGDGQYKGQVYLKNNGTELYVAKGGRFNVEGHFGWGALEVLINVSLLKAVPDFTHSQIQTLVGAIGAAKHYDIWVPASDRDSLDWSITSRFACRDQLPYGFEQAKAALEEVDVIWIERGSSELRALYEVEHSTPIYSGLLRFNDIHLVAPRLSTTFSIVANDTRRALFMRQVNRPTFRTSGLSELCTFLEYIDVWGWHKRVTSS
jgi:hypothetical protein